MNGKPTYEELENQVAELKKQNEIIRLNSVFQNEEDVKRAVEFINANQKIEENEERFKKLIWDMQVGVLLQGPQAEILLSNPASLELLGISEDQLLGKTSFDPDWNVIHEDGSPFPGATHPVPQAIAEGIPIKNVIMGVHRPSKNDRVWLLVDAIPQLNNFGEVQQVVCTFIDITKGKHAEILLKEKSEKIAAQNEELSQANKELLFSKQKIEESENQFRQLFENMEQGFALHEMIYDENNKPVDYRFLLINKAFENLTGIVASDFIGKTVNEVLSNNEKIWIENYGKVAQTGIPLHFENYAQEFDKYYNVVAFSPKKDFFAVIFTDVTKNRNYEKELIAAKELYIKIFEDFPTLIWRSRTDKLCNYFNKTWLDFTGRTMEQEFGNGWTEGVHPEDLDLCLEIYVTAFDKREAFLMDYRMKNKFGEYRWIRDFGRPFYDLDNTFLGYIGSCYDITENRNNELKLIEINADKDRFITILAHDLKNPFNSILGFLDLLNENVRTYDIDTIEEYLKIINTSAISTFQLLEDILLWVRANSGKIPYEPQKLNFVTICTEVIENLKLTANTKNITINLITPTEINLFADKNMMNTVLRNLISNAIKFTNKSGRIDIYAKIDHSKATITVSDNGLGIDSKISTKLFDIAHKISTDGTENEKGTGLGLLLCKEFVEKNNGKIWVETELGKGSDFKFTMPLWND